MKFKLRGHWWRVVWTSGKVFRRRFRKPDDVMGCCDHHDREITLRRRMSQGDELEFVIHEFVHSADEAIPEKVVQQTARAARLLLWRLGWRKTGG